GEPRHLDDRRADRRYLENDAVHGALDPRRAADDPQGHLRGDGHRRRQSGQGVLPRHPAAGAAGADGGGDLPPARRDAHLRPDLCADAQQLSYQNDVGRRARKPHQFRQVRLWLGRIDPALRADRGNDRPLYLARPRQSRRGRPLMLLTYAKRTGFYLLVAFIIFESIFPFYYAIITSFKSGTALFEVSYLPTTFSLDNYTAVLTSGSFPRNLLNSVFVSAVTVILALLFAVTAAYALSRVRFRGRSLLLLTILSVSMFPQIAVLAGLFEVIRAFGLYNTLWGLIFSYTIFTLPFTVWVLT